MTKAEIKRILEQSSDVTFTWENLVIEVKDADIFVYLNEETFAEHKNVSMRNAVKYIYVYVGGREAEADYGK